MNVYNLYIFNRNGICIYYHEWDRNKESNLPLNEVTPWNLILC